MIRENDKQKCILMIFFYFALDNVCIICCCSITHTVISLVAHKLNSIHINNLEKFTTCSSKFKAHGANLQNVSPFPVRFSTDIPFSSLVSFAFCLLVFSFLNWKIFILIHIRLSERASKFFTKPISGNKTTFLVLG